MLANGGLRLMVTFLPFATAVVAPTVTGATANTAITFYCVIFFLTSLFHNLRRGAVVHKRRLLGKEVSDPAISRLRRSYRFGMGVYAVLAHHCSLKWIYGLVSLTAENPDEVRRY
jgi:hypothetical protein